MIMQFYTIATLLFVSFVASSMALPARLAYYQQQPAVYYQTRAAPQRLMYMQYVQQPLMSRSSGRLTNAAGAFVAGNTVATGTYVKGDRSAEQQAAASETVLDKTGANAAQSIAEAYPAEYPQDDALTYEAPQVANEQVPYVPQAPEDEPAYPPIQADSQVLQDEAAPESDTVSKANPEPAAAADPSALEPASAAVELEDEVENDEDNDTSNDDSDYVPNNPRRRPAAKATPASPPPAGSFFSVDFGGANGGAVAISNSYSTGSNGSAKSQAVAFGNPEESGLKSASSRRRRH